MMNQSNEIGLVQWFPFEERDPVKRSIEVMQQLGVRDLRTCFSWADWERPGGPEWLDWLADELMNAGVRIYPSFFYTPMRCARLPPGACREEAVTAAPPERAEEYVTFIREMVNRYGHAFEWALLWNESNNNAYWRDDLDPEGHVFRDMMIGAMEVLHAVGKKAVIGALVPPYEPWIQRMKHEGVLAFADAVGVHDFPMWNEKKRGRWGGWKEPLANLRTLLYPHQEIWITETGYSTIPLQNPHDTGVRRMLEKTQVEYFLKLVNVDADRIFWYSIYDQKPGHMTDNERNRPDRPPHDPRADGLGIITYDGRPKRLFHEWRARAAGFATT